MNNADWVLLNAACEFLLGEDPSANDVTARFGASCGDDLDLKAFKRTFTKEVGRAPVPRDQIRLYDHLLLAGGWAHVSGFLSSKMKTKALLSQLSTCFPGFGVGYDGAIDTGSPD